MSNRSDEELIQAAKIQAAEKVAEPNQRVDSGFDSQSFESLNAFAQSLVFGTGAGEGDAKESSVAPSSEVPDGDLIGVMVHQYKILKRIGAGGMGDVYLAQHIRFTKRLYAIKFLKTEMIQPDLRARFEAEINAMEGLQHDNIVFAHDAGVYKGDSFLVMDFVEGADLKSVLKQHPLLELKDVAEMIRQTARGLQHAHEQGMVHRDIKPSNLILSREGTIKILDMGLARLEDSKTDSLTGTQQILGTPDYMAPEQWQETRSVDIRADIYSLGCTMYCLLAGRPPFDDESHTRLASKLTGHLNEVPPDVTELSAIDIPEEVVSILDKMLAKDPHDRFQTPDEISDALEVFAAGHSIAQLADQIKPVEIDQVITRSILDASEETHTREQNEKSMNKNPYLSDSPAVATGSFLPYIGYGLFGIGLCFLIALGFVLFPLKKGKESSEGTGSNSQITKRIGTESNDPNKGSSQNGSKGPFDPISVTNIRLVDPNLSATDPNQELIDMGKVGRNVFTVRYGDLLKARVNLPEERYCFLVALNPTDDPKFRIQLCYPANPDAIPAKRNSITFPEPSNSFFPLTDGIGQIAFLLIVSDTPLPSFSEWKRQNLKEDFPWKISKQTGVWVACNGEISRAIPKEGAIVTRGDPIEVKSNVLQRSFDYLEKKNSELHVFAFPVLKE